MGRRSVNSLAPGFRFHPTDEELVRYYLRRKVSAKPFRFDPISVIDIYKVEPWDLPDKSKLKSRDLEWYFFSALDKKYSNGSKTNRATEKGYWKTTGKDRTVYHNSRAVGMKKTLVYHSGRAPRGERSNWVMHEYRLTDKELEKAGIDQDAFVLCRVFQKSGSGPKNGERYGAPFVEEEWEDDEVPVLPGQVELADEVVVAADAYVDADYIDQKFDIGIPPENAPLPLNFYHGETSNYAEHSENYIDDDQKPVRDVIEYQSASELNDDQKLVYLPDQYKVDATSVKEEFISESSGNDDFMDVNFLLDEPYLDATDNPQLDDGLFLETNDLSDPVEADPAGFDMLEEYLIFFDADGENLEHMAFDPSQLLGNENLVPEEASLSHKHVNETTGQVSMASQQLLGAHGDHDASSSKQNPEDAMFESGVKYPFMKQASQMLGNIPAPPAFASELLAKDSVLLLNQAAQSSSSVHVTAGMIRIRNTTLSGNGMDWSFDKNGNVNITLSFSLSQGDISSASLVPVTRILPDKTGYAFSDSWFYLMFIWVVIIVSASFKIGSCIYTR